MFYDRATIFIKAGNGGDGSASFRREKFIPKGGPDGGDGGRGGSVYLRVNHEINTLLAFHYKQNYKATAGGAGGGRHKHGKAGGDLYIDVPPGTFVEIVDEDPLSGSAAEVSQTDLLRSGQTLLVARGGRGGLGNLHFTTATQQTPRFAEKGEPGDERTIHMELKLIADVGLVGYPNVGKSTLLSTVTAAQPKIGDYPFTTLAPMLGVVSVDDDTFVMADIPGLIEGASSGAGLGLEFLRHVERTRLLLHIVDGSAGLWNIDYDVPSAEVADGQQTTDDNIESVDGEDAPPQSVVPTPKLDVHPSQTTDPIGDFKRINTELAEYDSTLADRPQIVAINKADLQEVRDRLPSLIEQFREMGYSVYPISAATGEGVQDLLRAVAARLRELPKPEWDTEEAIAAEDETLLIRPHYASESKHFKVEEESKGRFRVSGSRIERLAVVTDSNNRFALERLDREMEKMGIATALRTAGIEPGDTVVIGRIEMDWGQEAWENFSRGASRRKRRVGPGKQKS